LSEQWKAIKGYEGRYEVSDTGKVRTFLRNKHRELKINIDKAGYCTVVLYKDNNCKTVKVHRLVAQAFLENPLSLPCVNHKNEIKTDNRVENLEFCTVGYNNRYGKRIEKMIKSKYKAVVQYDTNGNKIAEYESVLDAEFKTGIMHQNISKCCLKRKHFKTAGGFVWEYVKKE
jgi:hypothetical protein